MRAAAKVGQSKACLPLQSVQRWQQLVTPHHCPPMSLMIVVCRACMAFSDEGKQTIGAPIKFHKVLCGCFRITPVKRPNEPRIKGVVPRPIRDIGNARKKLRVDQDTRRLRAEMVQAADRLWRAYIGLSGIQVCHWDHKALLCWPNCSKISGIPSMYRKRYCPTNEPDDHPIARFRIPRFLTV